MKAQLRAADRSGARVALIVGNDELARGTVTLRPLRGPGEQRSVGRHELCATLVAAAADPAAADPAAADPAAADRAAADRAAADRASEASDEDDERSAP
jgi:hypothetical protein